MNKSLLCLTCMPFASVGRGQAVSLGFDSSEESQRMRAFFERGNAVTLEKLQRHFAGAP